MTRYEYVTREDATNVRFALQHDGYTVRAVGETSIETDAPECAMWRVCREERVADFDGVVRVSA